MPLVDRILHNGSIWTQDIYKPRVTALAIRGERIVAYGSDDAVLSLGDTHTIRENLERRVVIPGLTDAHLHWQMLSDSLTQVNLFEVPTKAEALRRIAERAALTPPGEWIVGYGWTQEVWADKAFGTAADLDSVAPNHPVYLQAKSIHAAWANTLAMRLSGIDDATADPPDGQIVRDASRRATGILLEGAMRLVRRAVPQRTTDQVADQMAQAQTVALASGLTGFHDFDGPDCFRALQRLRERGDLSMRVVKNINKEWLPAALDIGLRWGFGDDWLRIGGVKIFADGALGPRTASMIAPYDGEPDNYGIIVTDKEEMAELVLKASAAGLPSTIHAIGDRAVHDVLDVYQLARKAEAARGEATETRRHRIEHVQLIHPDDVSRLGSVDVIASMQPIHAMSDMDMADQYWGERARWSYNPKLALNQGVVVAFGSDAPVDSYEPLKGIHAAVARRRLDGSPGEDGWYPAARIAAEEALRCYTLSPAYAAGMEARLGKLAPGFLADLVVLSDDLITASPDAIPNLSVVATMVGGQWRYGGIA